MSTTQFPPLATPTLQTQDMSIWKPAVDGILRRYNDSNQREEAGAAAVVLLQAMTSMGVFNKVSVVPMPLRQVGTDQAGLRSSVTDFADSVARALDEPSKQAGMVPTRPRAPTPPGQ